VLVPEENLVFEFFELVLTDFVKNQKSKWADVFEIGERYSKDSLPIIIIEETTIA
jgi:hypothetical protein